MKKIVKYFGLLILIFIISNCAIINGAQVMLAGNKINNSVLSVENESFQESSGINLTNVKRGLWSMQNKFSRYKTINYYFESLMTNFIVYSIDDIQQEFAKQTVEESEIRIVINNQFQNYSEYERAILLIASTSTLALLEDTRINKNNIPNMFFRFIGEYDFEYGNLNINGIKNSQWFKDKNIRITDNGIIIG